MAQTKVLVVDDEPGVLASTRLLLGELGYAVVTEDDAGNVLETLARERPDVVLQDVRMPGLDLVALFERIRGHPAVGATPIVLFSASMDLDELREQVGAAGFVEKPFDPDGVSEAIRRAVEARGGTRTAARGG